MAMRAGARGITIPLTVRPDSSVRRALQGVTAAARKATAQELADAKRTAVEKRRIEAKAEREKERAIKRAEVMQAKALAAEKTATEKAARAAEKAAKKQADREIKEAERSAKAQVRAAEKAAAAQQRAVERFERWKISTQRASARMAEKAHREQVRTEESASQNRRRALATIGGGLVGGAMGAAGAAIGYAQDAKGKLGVQDHGDTIATAKDITENLIRQMTMAGKSSNAIGGMLFRVDQAAKRTSVPQAEIAASISRAQSKFSDPDFVTDNMDFLAEASRAAGESMESIVDFALTMKQVGGLDNDAAKRMVERQFIQGAEGSIEVKDFATTFAPSIATFAADTGASGEEDMAQITALAQVLGKSLKNPAEVATSLERFGSRLKMGTTQKALRKAGVDISNDKTGEIDVSPAEIFRQITQSEKLKNPQLRQKIFADLLGEGAAATLIKAEERDGDLFQRISNADPERGSELIREVNDRLDESPFSKIDKMNIEAQSVTLMNKDNYVDKKVAVTEALHQAQVEAPNATEMIGPALQTVAATGIGAAIGNVATRGGAGALGKVAPLARTIGGRAGGAVLGAGRAAAGGLVRGGAAALSLLGPAGLIGAGGLLAGGAIYSMFGDDIENWAAGTSSIPRATERGFGRPSAPSVAVASGPAPDAAASQQAMVDSLAAKTAAQVQIGKGKIVVEIQGPGRVKSITQDDNLPMLDNGSMASRM